MMDCFSPTFLKVFCPSIKRPKKRENSNFLLIGLTLFLSLLVYLLGIEMGVNVVCNLLLPETHDSSFS